MPFAVTHEMLDEAQAAYHALMLGESVVRFRDQNGEMVERTKADANKLRLYIDYLRSELGMNANSVGNGPMRVWM